MLRQILRNTMCCYAQGIVGIKASSDVKLNIHVMILGKYSYGIRLRMEGNSDNCQTKRFDEHFHL